MANNNAKCVAQTTLTTYDDKFIKYRITIKISTQLGIYDGIIVINEKGCE